MPAVFVGRTLNWPVPSEPLSHLRILSPQQPPPLAAAGAWHPGELMCLVSHWELGAGPSNFAAGNPVKTGTPKKGTAGARHRQAQPARLCRGPLPSAPGSHSQGQGTEEQAARTHSEGPEIHIPVTSAVGSGERRLHGARRLGLLTTTQPCSKAHWALEVETPMALSIPI